MLLLLESWLVLTAGMAAVLTVVIGLQTLARLLRRPAAAELAVEQPQSTGRADLRLAA